MKQKLKILALDIALNCGWCYYDGSLTSGTWDLKEKRDESKGMRFIRFKSKLIEINKLGIDLVVFEAARFLTRITGGAVVCQAELQGVVKSYCEENKIEFKGYSSKELKAQAGSGKFTKKQMIEAAVKKFGKDVADDNEADALWCLDKALEDFNVG